MGRLDGKVAFVTGAARGQGRSHAIELAREGADIIALDVAHDLPELGLAYPMGSAEDLAQTAAEVERLGRRVVTAEVDVRDGSELTEALGSAVAELGRLDVVVANAGIAANLALAHEITEQAWEQILSINLTGVWKTCKAAVPHVVEGGRGGSVIITSSMAGLRGYQRVAAYASTKHGLVGLMRVLAAELAPHSIRVNSVHPTQVNTPMIMNDETYKVFRPDLDSPTVEEFTEASAAMHALPVPWVESVDISRALVFLASEDARFITGVTLPIDAGLMIK
ncbi:NAD(P)-dependent oxidoreductase [Nocardioides immobilis]|uniref:NAD(P)-dependent oxidoreductase n=2 Tax=Nocardioides immobilis TaxID=2049295 RepID=A0A417Y6X8_9ACTN|nr:NAD(P)-dependent oxidoreductase [Nocardioides immobilis]